ncbi:MAG TPA: AAA family ATPase [Bacteroidia bacterium]|nr:AAA family ATPase [Bacteroidia bacterium]
MNFIFIFGPPAVGKMTVGQELGKLTGYRLFHNHVAIEPALLYFEFGTPPFLRIVNTIRKSIFEEVIKAGMPGFIFTYVWALNEERDLHYVKQVRNFFAERGANVFFVELEADLSTRLERNRTENRLLHKASKRDTEWSEHNIRDMETKYVMNSEAFPFNDPYLRINNSQLSAPETAALIREKFQL